MPDHVHLFVEGTRDDASLSTFVHRAKQLSGYHGRAVTGTRIWQTGFYERIVGLDEDPRPLIAYILQNPVRRGLAASADRYAFTGSGVYAREDLFRLIAPGSPCRPDL
jgi:REP element-mobilizing transposase RayT